MDLLLFDANEQFIASVGTEESGAIIISDEWDELQGTYQIDLIETDAARARLSVGMFVAFHDTVSDIQMFEVRDLKLIRDNSTVVVTRIYAEHVRYEMINDPIEDRRVYRQQAQNALDVALEGTRWRIGQRLQTAIGSVNFYYESALSAITKIQEEWGLRLSYRIVMAQNAIIDRIVDMTPSTGRDIGKRFEYKKDIIGVRQTVSLSSTATALYGRGKAEQVTENGYGRKITFADVEWSKANGDPADKPLGQEWIGDTDALVQWNRGGRHRFGFADFPEIESPAELLQSTWDALQARKTPTVGYEMTVIDLERLTGYPHENVRQWDRVRVIDKSFNPPLLVEAEVISIRRSKLKPQNTKITLGNYSPSIVNTYARTQINLSKIADLTGAHSAELEQAMNLLNNPGASYVKFMPDISNPSEIYIMDNEAPELAQKVMRFNVNGWGGSVNGINGPYLISATLDGQMNASRMTTGVLNAGLVKISGTGTYLDGTSLVIQHPDIAARTVLDTDGLKLYAVNPNNSLTLKGGFYKPAGSADPIMSAAGLSDPSVSANTLIRLKYYDFIQSYGLDFLINGIEAGYIAYQSDGMLTLRANGDMVLQHNVGTFFPSFGVQCYGGQNPRMFSGSTSINSSTWTQIDISSGGFSDAPRIIASYSTTGTLPTSLGPILIQGKNRNFFYAKIDSALSTSATIDWIAFSPTSV